MLPAAPGSFLVLVGAVLMAVATCSTPIIKSLAFLNVDLSSVSIQGHSLNGTASFGCLGYCLASNCTSPKLGYTFDLTNVADQLGAGSAASGLFNGKVSSGLVKGLTYTMVLHPICAGLAAVAAVFGFFSMCDGCLSPCLSGLLTGIATTVALIAFIFDLATFLILKNRLKDDIEGLKASLGSALWLVLAAWIIILLGSCGLGAGLCRARRYYADRHRQRADDLGGSGGQAMPYGQGVPLSDVKSTRSQRSRSRGLWHKHDDADSDDEGMVVKEEEGLLHHTDRHDEYASMPAYPAHPVGGSTHDAYADPYMHQAYPNYPVDADAIPMATAAGYSGYGYPDNTAGTNYAQPDYMSHGQQPYDYSAPAAAAAPHTTAALQAPAATSPTYDNMYGLHR